MADPMGTVMREPQPADAKEPKPEAAPAPDVEQLTEQVRQAKDQYLRTLAEVENTKKRLLRDREEFAKYAAEAMIRQLLPIIDGMGQALVTVGEREDPVITGVNLIHRQLLGVLAKEGVKRIPTVGERFDPHLHEAVGTVPAAEKAADGAVAEEVHAGYTMHGKVIRPAMVKVAKYQEHEAQHPTIEGGSNG